MNFAKDTRPSQTRLIFAAAAALIVFVNACLAEQPELDEADVLTLGKVHTCRALSSFTGRVVDSVSADTVDRDAFLYRADFSGNTLVINATNTTLGQLVDTFVQDSVAIYGLDREQGLAQISPEGLFVAAAALRLPIGRDGKRILPHPVSPSSGGITASVVGLPGMFSSNSPPAYVLTPSGAGYVLTESGEIEKFTDVHVYSVLRNPNDEASCYVSTSFGLRWAQGDHLSVYFSADRILEGVIVRPMQNAECTSYWTQWAESSGDLAALDTDCLELCPMNDLNACKPLPANVFVASDAVSLIGASGPAIMLAGAANTGYGYAAAWSVGIDPATAGASLLVLGALYAAPYVGEALYRLGVDFFPESLEKIQWDILGTTTATTTNRSIDYCACMARYSANTTRTIRVAQGPYVYDHTMTIPCTSVPPGIMLVPIQSCGQVDAACKAACSAAGTALDVQAMAMKLALLPGRSPFDLGTCMLHAPKVFEEKDSCP